VFESAFMIDQGRKWLNSDGLEHEGRISYHQGLALALLAFRQAQAAASTELKLLMRAEQTFLGQELQFCTPTDTNAKTSLKTAIREFDEGFAALDVLQDTENYTIADKILSTRQEFRYKSMPKDAFHVACAGHYQRITNILKAPGINLNEKELLEQRRSNMATAQSVYLEKQRAVLSKG
jgi:hypothetical protein